MVTETDENYLKETYVFQQEHGRATTSMFAERFGSSAATVTGMLKRLAERKLVEYEPYRGVTLTETGRAIALEVIRHHRLLETYLSQALGLPWDRVHEEAERLEHVLSQYLEDRIDEHLGHPTVDPHGSPIPSADGRVAERPRLRLSELAKGATAEIVEVWDRDPEMLLHLDALGLHLHTTVTVIEVEPIDGLVSLEVSGRRRVVGPTTAGRVYVRELAESDGSSAGNRARSRARTN